jgi:hypothetical protein
MFALIWANETIDSFETRAEAEEMRNEYNLAYGGGVTIEYVEESDLEDDWEDDGQPSWEQEWEDFGECYSDEY